MLVVDHYPNKDKEFIRPLVCIFGTFTAIGAVLQLNPNNKENYNLTNGIFCLAMSILSYSGCVLITLTNSHLDKNETRRLLNSSNRV